MPDKTPRQQIDELKDLVVAYAKQETIEPFKGIGRYVGMGIAGAIALGTGVAFVALGLLRLLQTEGPDALHRRGWSETFPYLIVLAALAAASVLAWKIGTSDTSAKTKDQP